ncbi:MAG: hypothetical protein IKY52_10235 [Clostridia bacterium]|nr:hypothetical protein [Clostridia bacterium]
MRKLFVLAAALVLLSAGCGEAEEPVRQLMMASADMAGQYVIADIVSDKADGITKTGKMVYDTENGVVQVYWLRVKAE